MSVVERKYDYHKMLPGSSFAGANGNKHGGDATVGRLTTLLSQIANQD